MQILSTKEKYGLKVNLHDFSQVIFERFQEATVKATRDAFYKFNDTDRGVTATAVQRGEMVRAAIKFEVISGLTAEQVNDLKPYVVTWLANEIQNHVIAITTAPADPN